MVSSVLLMASATATGGPAVSQVGNVEVTVAREVHRDVSRPMRDVVAEMGPARPMDPADNIVPNQILSFSDLNPLSAGDGTLTAAQRAPSGDPAPAASLAVNGLRIGLGGGGVPPDTTGEVGPDHYFQWVNTSWALFNKSTGALVSGPTSGNSFFSGFGGLCQTTNRGDPLVLFDDIAQRWVVSQFAFTAITTAPWLQCVAVSTSADPLGTYNRYAFSYPNFNDYGKMGVWVTSDGSQNAYVFTMHEFNTAPSFVGTSFALVERDRMLAGQSAQFIRVGGISAFGALPFHLEGVNPLPPGACPMFVHFQSNGAGYRLWDMCVNWTSGSTSFIDNPTLLASTPFTLGLNGIPQLSSTQRLDSFDGNTMYLAALRSFGPTGPRELRGVINHAVDVGADQAGTRWIEFGFTGAIGASSAELFANGFEDAPPAAPSTLSKRIVNQGTFAPDTTHRWMGGINIDANGNIGLGYNASSSTVNPEVRYTGRERGDPAGFMRDEVTCTPANTGAQTGLFGGRARWGDYATMSVDPSNQCTFWFTNEYYPVTATSSWNTRICAFTFPSCGQPDFVLEVSDVAACGTGGGVSGTVRVGALGGFSGNVTLGTSGLPGGVSASFAPTTAGPGGQSTVTFSGANALAAGSYPFTVTATAGPLNRSSQASINVSSAPVAAPSLTAPANNASTFLTRPTLTWGAVAGAIRYRADIATDAAFANIVSSGTTTGTSFTSTVSLTPGTSYFWRVASQNNCGDTLSSSRQFTVAVPGTCPVGTTANVVFNDDVSGSAVAWVTQSVSGDADTLWTRRVPPANTGLTTQAWYAGNSTTTADQRLTSPTIVLPAAAQSPIFLAFDAYHQYETDGGTDCYDGGHVEISTNGGGTFTPLTNARNVTDPYLGVLSAGNPAQGTQAWCRQPKAGTSIRTVFLLDDFAGQSVQLRFRSTADSITVGPAPNGWAIDNIQVSGCQ